MKKASFLAFLVLCAIAVACSTVMADDGMDGAYRVTSAPNADPFGIPTGIKEKLAKLMVPVSMCAMSKGLGWESKISEVAAAMVECLNGDKDNTGCCKKAGLSGEKCLKNFCDGTPPAKVHPIYGPEREKDGCDFTDDKPVDDVIIGVLGCFEQSQ